MAIAFELVINFGSDRTSASAARRLTAEYPSLAAGRHDVPLHEPLMTTVRGSDGDPYLEMAVLPVGVGLNVALDRDHERLPLTAAEFSELGVGLYELLKRFTGYRAAQVGWDPEGGVDLAELRDDYADDLAAGELPGLVLAEDLHQDLTSHGFVPFTQGFVWIPYRGERPSSITADPVV